MAKKAMAAIVLAAALLPGCGVFSHKLARPIVHHAQGQWTHENTTIYGSVSSFRVRHMQARMKLMNFSISTANQPTAPASAKSFPKC